MNDDMGDRLKTLEMSEAGRCLLPLVPAMCRLDGRCFHEFTKDMERPFDQRFCDAIIDTTKYLMMETAPV